MQRILTDECNKPGLKSWVGTSTDIRVKKLNVFWHNFCEVDDDPQ